MSQVTVLKKTLKYLLYLLLLLVMIVAALVAYVLKTEAGSRFTINQGIEYAGLDLTYDSINGNLSDGLVISNFKYTDQAIDIKINKVAYKSQWTWFSRYLELSEVHIQDVLITTRQSPDTGTESQPFTGFEMPISIDLKGLLIERLNFASESTSNSLEAIELVAFIEPKTASIDNLIITGTDYGLSSKGSIDFSSGLAYKLDADWQVKSEGQSIQANGPIEGDLNNIGLQQSINLESEQLQGLFQIQGSVTALQLVPKFNLQLSSNAIKLLSDQNTLELKNFGAEIKGLIDAYTIDLQSELSQNKIKDIHVPSTQIKLQASGNTQQLTTQLAQIITPEGVIDLQAGLNWQDQFQLDSRLELRDFNPQQLLQEWPGMISGKVALDLKVTEQGVIINTSNNSLKGQLKGQPFLVTGSAKYATGTVSADQLQVSLGANTLLIDGQVNEQNVTLSAAVDWVDLKILDPQLTGSIEGTVALTGNYLTPRIKADLIAELLTLGEHQVSKLTVSSQGEWNKNLTSQVVIDNATLGGQEFASIQIMQSGWLDEHDVEVAVDGNEFSSNLQLSGQYLINTAADKLSIWKGQINSHELIVDTDKKIELQSPVAITIAESITIEAGCWQGVEAGTLCIELNDIKQTDDSYRGSLTLDAFSLIPLQVFLPQNVEVKGKIKGSAEFVYQADALIIESNLRLQEGELLVQGEQEMVYQTVIETFVIDAKTTNQDINISINTQLADKSHLSLEAMFENPGNQDWKINSNIKGVFYSTGLIKELTEEINELEGQISIDGNITGFLSQPKINLTLSQPDGYMALTRLGTIIEKLKLSITTEDIQQLVYSIVFSGNNLTAINQGQIESIGELSFASEQQWQYLGDITGENFMLLNLPEAKFNISPKLTIMANPQSTDIKGDLIIDSGHVTVKQLPASSVSNSDDLEIHTSESESSMGYPVNMNIKASIKDPIELDVIGLVAGLSGSIQLIKTKEQSMAGKGILNLSDGSYEIYGQKLDIDEGELTFTGPLDNPRLNVRASRKSVSGDVIAGVELGGTVNNLQSNLFSEPSLSDIEKLSYIMTGRGIDNSGSLDGESLKQAAIVMGLNQSSPVFNQIQNQFGIDVLTLRESAVAADTVVEAGKKINDKLYVSYNQGLFNRLGFWMLRYRINQFLNLQTTQGEDQSIEVVYTRKANINKATKDAGNK